MKKLFDFRDKTINRQQHFILKVNMDLFDPWDNTDPYNYIRDQYALGAVLENVTITTEDNFRIYRGIWKGKTIYDNK